MTNDPCMQSAVYRRAAGLLHRLMLWSAKLKVSNKPRNLRVLESLSLGEKRFVALIQVKGNQFLVGGSANSLSLLARIEDRSEFDAVLEDCYQRQS